MTNDEIARLRAELAGLTGPARTQPLLRLGQLLSDRYWRAGPGSPAALVYLDEGVPVLQEAYGYLAPGDILRANTGVSLGVLHGLKHSGHFGPPEHRETAIQLLEDSVDFAGLQPVLADTGRVMLGQLLVGRVVSQFQSPDFLMAAMRGGAAFSGAADLDRAAGIYRGVLARSTMAEARKTAQAMLTMIEAVQSLLGGFSPGVGGFDLNRMMDAVATMQRVKSDLPRFVPGVGASPVPDLMTADWLASLDPLDRPVGVVNGPEPADADAAAATGPAMGSATVPPPAPRPAPAAPRGPDVAEMRRELLRRLSPDGDPFAAAAALLAAEGAPDWIDTFVSLATSIVHAADEATGTDHFLLAAALQLRGRRDAGGWGEPDGDAADWDGGWDGSGREANGDTQAAAASLGAAMRTLPTQHPDGVPAALLLGMLLPDEVFAEFDEYLAPVAAAARRLGADAVVFPEPAAALRLNAQTGRLEASGEAELVAASTVVLSGADMPPASGSPVWHLGSMTQLLRLPGRDRRAVTDDPLFVVNPRGDRQAAAFDAMVLRRTFYPRSTGLGALLENADGAGTPDEVRAASDASLLHLDCGLTPDGALELADGARLDLSEVTTSRGGLVILPPGAFLPAADLLLAAGFRGVIGWRRRVPAPAAALILFLLHAELADNGRTPAAAIGELRRWFADPDRKLKTPSHLPAGYADRLDATEERDWTALVYRGG